MNSNQFSIGDYQIDISRNRIKRAEKITTMEPKVMEVLLLLAKHQGEVVSHQKIIEQVWPNSVEVANTLQRCITQLRKALDDDGKTQAVIQTHAKKGYSLVLPVNWKLSTHSAAPSFFRFSSAALLFTGLLIATVWYLSSQSSSGLPFQSFDKITPITLTDQDELFSVFSSDGKYIAFIRHEKGGISNLWLKDRTNEQEYRLTDSEQHIDDPAWSPDNKYIAAFIRESNALFAQPQLAVIKIPEDLNVTVVPEVLYQCDKSVCEQPQWTSQNSVAFIKHDLLSGEIMEIDVTDQTVESVYQDSNNFPYSISYADKQETLAIMLRSESFEHNLLLKNTKSKEQKLLPFSHQYGNSFWDRWYPSWNANQTALIYSHNSSLYQLSLDGEISEKTLPTFKYISRPQEAPDGSSIAMTLGSKDADIIKYHWEPTDSNSTPLHRSILAEYGAKYQPNSGHFAFLSERSGSLQLWLSQDGQLQQISQLSPQDSLRFFVWSPDGSQIAALVNDDIVLFGLDGSRQLISIDIPIIKFMQWTEANTFLLATFEQGEQQLIEFDWINQTKSYLYQGYLRWAQRDADNELLINARDGYFYRINQGKLERDKRFAQLQTFWYFIAKPNGIYWNTREDELWHYEYTSQSSTKLIDLGVSSYLLEDVNPTDKSYILSQTISQQQEIVLLHQ